MLKSNRLLIILIFLSLSFYLIGCNLNTEKIIDSNENKSEDVINQNISNSKILSPVEIPILYENAIEIVNIENDNYVTFKINGLRDKDVENKINNSIDEMYQELIDISTLKKPLPYRGLNNLLYKEGVVVENIYVNVTPAFNYNNILSVSGFVNLSYLTDTGEYKWLNHNMSLNFDLKTGKAIPITDLLTDDVDSIGILNDIIKDKIDGAYGTDEFFESNIFYYDQDYLSLVSPFKGIKEDQSYIIYPHGLQLIFDFKQPEFLTPNGSVNISISLMSKEIYDKLAFLKRFKSDYDIFDYPITMKSFLPVYDENRLTQNSEEKFKDAIWYKNQYFTSDIPDKVLEESLKIRNDITNKLKLSIENKNLKLNYIDEYVMISKTDRFFNLRIYLNYSEESNYYNETYMKVFDSLGGEIELESLFDKDVDYKNILNELAKKQGISEIDFEKIMFNIENDHIYFTANNNFDVVDYSFYLSYKEIGIENLSIFNE